jgi:hypothetical protein
LDTVLEVLFGHWLLASATISINLAIFGQQKNVSNLSLFGNSSVTLFDAIGLKCQKLFGNPFGGWCPAFLFSNGDFPAAFS